MAFSKSKVKTLFVHGFHGLDGFFVFSQRFRIVGATRVQPKDFVNLL